MAIWLTYTHKIYLSWAILMPWYIYALQKNHIVDSDDEQALQKLIDEWHLLSYLENPRHDRDFDDPLIRKIMLEAYPYEVELKFLGKDIKNDTERNQRLVSLFNNLFATDYHGVLGTYTHQDQLDVQAINIQMHEHRFEDIEVAKKQYIDFSIKLFEDQWYHEEAKALDFFCTQRLTIEYSAGISWVTIRKGNDIYIWLGNKTYTTMFHEMTHAINNYFKFEFYDNIYTCDHKTKTNEGLSNFVAYHLLDNIVENDIYTLDQMSLDPLFFSMYIDIYKTLTESGLTNRNTIYSIVQEQLKSFEWDLLTPTKADFYYQRFFKYFHYDQTTYMYPKEMMYYLGYRWILQLFNVSQNKKALLTQALLGRICL